MTSVTATKPAPRKVAAKKAASPAPTPDPTFTISTRTFLRDLHEVRTFASTDVSLPVICCVKVTMKDGSLRFAATDRYVMGIVTEANVAASKDFNFLLSGETVDHLARVLKPRGRQDDPPLRITVGAKSLSVEQASSITDLSPSVIVVPTFESTFPDYTKIIGSHKPAEEVLHSVALNPKLVAKFARAVRSDIDGGMVVHPGTTPLKPLLITIGEHFVGILMPMRRSEKAVTAEAALARVA